MSDNRRAPPAGGGKGQRRQLATREQAPPTAPTEGGDLPRRAQPIRRRQRQPMTDLTTIPENIFDRGGIEDSDFLPAALEIVETRLPFKVTFRVYLVCGAILGAIVWATLYDLSTYAIATGEIEAVGQTKVIEPLQAGQVSALKVKDGDHVKAGDVLVELNPTELVAARTIIVDQLASLRAEAARRRVETLAARADPVNVKPEMVWDADVPAKIREREESVLHADLTQLASAIADLQAQRVVKIAARDAFKNSIDAQKSLIEATNEQVSMHQQLEVKGWDSHARVLQAMEPLKQQQVALTGLEGNLASAVAAIAVVDAGIAKARESFVSGNVQKIADDERQIASLNQQLSKAGMAVANMTLKAPIDGAVHALAVTSLGQAVTPGQQLMQVVPEGASMEVIAYVLNTDIGFVREGQPAIVKVDTFPYTRYGAISGKVVGLAADAITGAAALGQQKNASQPAGGMQGSATTAAEQTGDLVFPVRVALDRSTIDVRGKPVELSPGMSVVVEITTGKQKAIAYVLYPLVRGEPPKPLENGAGS